MTLQEFQKTVIKTTWYDKYYYYLISVAAIGVSIYLFYDIGTNPLKYKSWHSYEIALISYSFLFLIGCYAIYLIPNRYKILTIINNLSVDKKEKVISELLDKLNISNVDRKAQFYSFKYQRKWWTSDYDVCLYVDSEKFYVSVLGTTHAYPASGFIDFGRTERLRKKITSTIKSLAGDE